MLRIVVVLGSPFVPGSTVALRKSGQPDLPVLQSTMSPDDTSITAQLDLSTAVLGSYDLVVTTPSGTSSALAGAYTVQAASAPNLCSFVSVKPDGEAAPDAGAPACGDIMQAGTSCDPDKKPIPTPPPPPPGPPPAPKPLTAAECRDLPKYHVSADGTECVEDPRSGCSPTAVSLGPPECNRLPIIGSVDPNEKDGPLGIGSQHFTLSDDPLHYQVEFENTPTATAPAQTVSVTDPLDTSLYDLSTFQLGPISFGPYVVSPPPGLTSYSKALDLRPSENVIVSINANLDKSTGIATWNFTSLDPATMQLVTDPTAGFLPPDTNPPAGIGHVKAYRRYSLRRIHSRDRRTYSDSEHPDVDL